MHSLSEDELEQLYDWVESWPEVAEVYRHPLRPCVKFWPMRATFREMDAYGYDNRPIYPAIYQVDWEGLPDTGSLHYSRCVSYHDEPTHEKQKPVETYTEEPFLLSRELGEWGDRAHKQVGWSALCYGNTRMNPSDPVGLMLKLRAFATAYTGTSDKFQEYHSIKHDGDVMVNAIVFQKNGVKTVPLSETPAEYQRNFRMDQASLRAQV